MEYKQELKELFFQLGLKLLKNRNNESGFEVRIQFEKLLLSKFGDVIGGLLSEAVCFSPAGGLNHDNLYTHLFNLSEKIENYFSQENNVIDARKLLELRWACMTSALLNKKDDLVKFSIIGLKYHDKTDNSSWHNTTAEWNFMINNPTEFINAMSALKEYLNENRN
ncbi:MAG: hypothetical protein SGJ00_14365 [bacterium]|nr:hypothetical protein [bacterium]